jgi:cyclase
MTGTRTTGVITTAVLALVAQLAGAQQPGPHFTKVGEGIYVYAANPGDSNCGIILTDEGVILIDSGYNPPDAHVVLKAVKELTSMPIRFLIDTEPHADHTTGHFVFSPPAIVVAHEGAGASMRRDYDPARNDRLRAESPAMREALDGFRLVTPHVEYRQRMQLTLGGRTLELLHLRNVHSEADTAVWLPNERVLFSAAVAGVKRFSNLRPLVEMQSMIESMRMLKSLNPAVVVPGHGPAGTSGIFDDSLTYYTLLLERVGALVRQGRSLDQIKREVGMPETDGWALPERFPSNVEAAYRAMTRNRP